MFINNFFNILEILIKSGNAFNIENYYVDSLHLIELVLIVLAYLLGSVSSAIILSRLMGFTDPRTEGSNNPGATNVLRIAGKKAAILTLLGDLLKGFIPVMIAYYFSENIITLALVGLSAFLGHCYPLFFGFKGGKGVATAFGFIFAFNWIWGLIIFAIWLFIAKVLKISSLSAIIAFAVLPVLSWWHQENFQITLILLVLSTILIWRHRSNIQRMLIGQEK